MVKACHEDGAEKRGKIGLCLYSRPLSRYVCLEEGRRLSVFVIPLGDRRERKDYLMELLTEDQRARLLENGRKMAEEDLSTRLWPVVKLFTPDAGATWLLAWLEPEEDDIAWGLCDPGLGYPEIGPVRLSEIAAVRGALGLPVERDLYFEARMSLSDYAAQASKMGRLVA